MSDAWYLPESVADARAENRLSPNQPCSYETLGAAGVTGRRVNPKELSTDVDGCIRPLLDKLGYSSFDIVDIRPATLDEDKFESMAKLHFQEHLHEDDEVRIIVEGEGYFDVRDAQDRWVRVLTKPGDFLSLPAGIYHRFTTGPGLYTKAIRLFRENPKWEALNRGPDADATPARAKYLAQIHATPVTAVGPAEGAKNGVYSLRYPLELDAELTQIVRAHLSQHDRAKTALVLYVTGASDPQTGHSWCPDCVAAKPQVIQIFKTLQQKLGGGVVFVEAPVERLAYAGNPAFPYRTHPTLKVHGVPTLLVLTPSSSLTAADAPSVSSIDQPWDTLLQVKVYTEEPSVELLAGLV